MNKSLLFFKAQDNQIEFHKLNHFVCVYLLAEYYDSTHVDYGTHVEIPTSTGVYYDDRIYKVTSEIHTPADLKTKFTGFGTWMNATDAYDDGNILQPDREVDGPEGPFNFVFSLGIVKDDLKKQVKQVISDLDELKAQSLKLKVSPVQAETDFMSQFLTDRQTILDQYEADKITFGF